MLLMELDSVYNMPKPRYAVVFINRWCPRQCTYCKSRLVKPSKLLKPEEWIKAFEVLKDNDVKFFLILGNEVLVYPGIVDLVKMLRENGFWGMYAMYSTFPEPWYSLLRYKLVDAGLYNMSAGVDIVSGITTGDESVDAKSVWGLEQLIWFREQGVPDLDATITIHRYNYRYLDKILDVVTSNGIWGNVNMIHYSEDGLHDFYGTVEELKSFIIPESEREEFKYVMYYLAEQVRRGRWMFYPPPEYLELLGDLGGKPIWHCSLPLEIAIEADGELRLCGYRPFFKHRGYSVFDIGSKITIYDYMRWFMEERKDCPGCVWSCFYTAEYWYYRDVGFGDKVFQQHASKYWRGGSS